MIDFKSIVILDLETTGLPCYSHKMTKITELAMIACETEHILSSVDKFPRVIHKLVLCFNPRQVVTFGATQASELDNDLLQNVSSFRKDDICTLINMLTRLPDPVCLVAHNGNRFDFPILKHEIESCGEVMPLNLYCVDSLVAFRHLYPKIKKLDPKAVREFENKRYDSILLQAWENLEGEKITNISPLKNEMQNSNETTPKANIVPRYWNYNNTRRNLLDEFNETENQTVKVENNFDDFFSTQSSNIISGCPKSHKLCDIYSFLHNKEFSNGHQAEHDCMALLSCVIKSGQAFIDWMKTNAIPFNNIQPL